MVEIFQFNETQWRDLSYLSGCMRVQKTYNHAGNFNEAIAMEKELFSQLVARQKRTG